MAGRRAVRVVLVTLILLGGGVSGTLGDTRAVATPGGDDGFDEPPAPTVETRQPLNPGFWQARQQGRQTATASQPEVDTATTRIAVHPDGSATWTVEIRTGLSNETDLADYRRFQDRFRNDTDRYLGPFRERMTHIVARAGNVTGREMRAGNFSATTRIQQTPRQWGIVEYSFHWEGFAAVDDGTIRVGDVFESGYYLTEGDSLVIEAPAGYRIEQPRPTPERQSTDTVRWVGPIDFADRRPATRLTPVSATPTGTDTRRTTADGDGQSTTTTGTTATSNSNTLPFVGGLAVLVLAGGVYVVFARRDDEHGDDPDEAAHGEADESGPTAGIPTDETLVTDEERVRDLLATNDGRMRQADIAAEFDWSAAKTSRVLSDMADAGSIEKLRLGNENVIDLVDDLSE